jgi:hypothetical protein
MSSDDWFPDARDEIRVSEFGLLRCPSCGELAAELLGRHNLILTFGETLVAREIQWGRQVLILSKGDPWCECRDGQRTPLDGYEAFVAASNIAVADTCWFNENRMWRKLGFPA